MRPLPCVRALGRLIRREGLAKRNIWFLGGRIHTKRGLFHKVNFLLRNYQSSMCAILR
jgi:hypothetical protein